MDLYPSWTILKLLKICAVLSVAAGSNPHFVYREDWRERSCMRVLHRVTHLLVSSPLPPSLTGNWVSYRCEIRSGPEYVIRHVTFQNNTFESVVYRYHDPECHVPMYAIQSRGTYKLLQQSWTVRGATEVEYDVTSSYLITYSKNVSQDLAEKLAQGCGDEYAVHYLTPYTRYLIYSSAPSETPSRQGGQPEQKAEKPKTEKSEIDCFSALNFTLHELQLVMVEFRRHHVPDHKEQHHSSSDSLDSGGHRQHHSWPDTHMTRELLLGAVHPRPLERQKHRPSSFQTSLKDAQTPGCGVCSKIANSSPMYPPHLTSHTGTLLSLEGEWVSTRCESRQYGMFLTRWLHFLSDGSSWQGQYDYYHDALCRMPSFSLYAKGSYAGGTDSQLVEGAKDFSFKVTRLKVTPHDQATVDSMNHYDGNGCGKAHAWTINQEQDVTWTGGCITLGIRLPNMERDIMKMEVVHRKLNLYVGQRLVDKRPGATYQKERPTAFQEPLVKCDQVSLDMSINTAPGGHGWAGSVALPLSSGPDDFPMLQSGSRKNIQLQIVHIFMIVITTIILEGM